MFTLKPYQTEAVALSEGRRPRDISDAPPAVAVNRNRVAGDTASGEDER